MRIGLLMIVKNESSNIKNSIQSVKDIVDDIIIVDTGSTDKTIEIATDIGATVYEYKWDNNFANARNYGISKSNCDWHLFLDADEVLVNGDREGLEKFILENDNHIGRILVSSKFIEDGEISFSKERISRFAPKEALFTGAIHEQLDLGYPRRDIELKAVHSGYYNTDKSERNLKILLKALKKDPSDNYLLYQMAKTLSVSKEYKKASIYFKKAYKYLPSKTGYTKNCIVSYLYNLIHTPDISSGLKIIKKHESTYIEDTDFNFACGIYYMNLVIHNTNRYISYLPKIETHYKKCIEIGDANSTVKGLGSFKAYHNLGALYEVMGDLEKSLSYYKIAASYDYTPSTIRINAIKQNLDI